MQDLHHDLIEGRATVSRVSSVVELETRYPGYAVIDASGDVVEPVVPYLRELALDDNRPLTAAVSDFGLSGSGVSRVRPVPPMKRSRV
jgi:hypothetical protein